MGTLRLASMLVALAVIFGCGGSSVGTNQPPDPAVAFINTSPDSAALDAFLNSFQLADNVPYLGSAPRSGAVTTFAVVEPNDYDVIVEPDGDPANGDTQTAVLNRDTSYLIFAFGLQNAGAEFEKRLQSATSNFDRSRPNGDKARLIVFHAYNSAPGFETPAIDFRNPGDNPQLNLSNIGYGNGTVALIDSGAQTFVARRNGSEFELTPQVTFTFGAGKIYAAVVSGVEDAVGGSEPKITFLEIQTK